MGLKRYVLVKKSLVLKEMRTLEVLERLCKSISRMLYLPVKCIDDYLIIC